MKYSKRHNTISKKANKVRSIHHKKRTKAKKDKRKRKSKKLSKSKRKEQISRRLIQKGGGSPGTFISSVSFLGPDSWKIEMYVYNVVGKLQPAARCINFDATTDEKVGFNDGKTEKIEANTTYKVDKSKNYIFSEVDSKLSPYSSTDVREKNFFQAYYDGLSAIWALDRDFFINPTSDSRPAGTVVAPAVVTPAVGAPVVPPGPGQQALQTAVDGTTAEVRVIEAAIASLAGTNANPTTVDILGEIQAGTAGGPLQTALAGPPADANAIQAAIAEEIGSGNATPSIADILGRMPAIPAPAVTPVATPPPPATTATGSKYSVKTAPLPYTMLVEKDDTTKTYKFVPIPTPRTMTSVVVGSSEVPTIIQGEQALNYIYKDYKTNVLSKTTLDNFKNSLQEFGNFTEQKTKFDSGEVVFSTNVNKKIEVSLKDMPSGLQSMERHSIAIKKPSSSSS